MFKSFASLVIVSLISQVICSQEATIWQPLESPTFKMTQSVVARIEELSDAKYELSVLIPDWKGEVRTKMVTDTKFATETRTREVEKDGVSRTETYTVQVPYSEQREATYTYWRSSGKSIQKFSLSEVEIWTLDGKRLSDEQAIAKLKKPAHLLRWTEKDVEPSIEPFYRALLNPKVLIIKLPENARPVPELSNSDPANAVAPKPSQRP